MDNNAIVEIQKILDSYKSEESSKITKSEMIHNLPEFILSMKHEEKSKKTLEKYERDIRKFIDFVEDGQVTKEDTIRYKEHLIQQGYEVSSINSFITIINKYLKFMNCENIRIKQLRVQFETSIKYSISDADYHKMLRVAKSIGQIDTYYIIKILAETGIRIEELKYFTVENLQKDKFYLTVRNKGKTRTVIVHQSLSRDLRNYAKEYNIKEGFLFAGKVKGKMLNHSTIWRRLKKIAGLSKVKKEKIHPHAFRHYFAKKYLEQHPDNILGLADLLGHGSLKTTRIYQMQTDEEKRKIVENMTF